MAIGVVGVHPHRRVWEGTPQDFDALKQAGAAAIFPPGTVISTAAQDLIRQLSAERGYADAAE